MQQLVTSDFKLGIIAGGQLGKMLALAASNWDVKTYVLDNDPQCPASSCTTGYVKGSLNSYDDVYNFGKSVDMITFEIESVNVDALIRLKQEGIKIYPDPEALRIIQDKGLQKQFFATHDIPTSDFNLYDSKEAILAAIEKGTIAFPFVQKLRTGGYDGRGVVVVKSANDLTKLLEGPSVIEDLVDIEREVSVIAARNLSGQVNCFPLVEMEFNETANLVELLICPSTVSDAIAQKAEEIAIKLIDAFGLSGLLAVEMFVDKQGNVWVNEVAPRPHNSGHHTIESMVTSQYEQLLRAIFNFPLGSTRQKLPAVMINLLGEPGHEGPVKYEGLPESLAIDGVKVHLYGKTKTMPYRKMGHVTIIAPTIEQAKENAEKVKQLLKVKSWKSQ